MSEFKIEKDIPIPERTAGRSGIWKNLVKQMSCGDSVLVATRKNANSLRAAIASQGHKPVMRKEGDGFRVWKMEDKNK